MRWFQGTPQREKRSEGRIERRSATNDVLLAALLGTPQAASAQDVLKLAVVEQAAGLWARAMAAATVEGEGTARAVTPWILSQVGRALMREGEVLLVTRPGGPVGVRLVPAASWTVVGGKDGDWVFQCRLADPTGSVELTVSQDEAAWLPWAVSPLAPWRGQGPYDFASLSASTGASAATSLSQEANGPTGALLPIPPQSTHVDDDGHEVDPLEAVRAKLAGMKGSLALVETTTSGWGDGAMGRPAEDWTLRRVHPEPSPELLNLYAALKEELLAAAGIPAGLGSAKEGAAAREAYRVFLVTSVRPLLTRLAVALSRCLETPVEFTTRALDISDLAGRARSFKALVESGMDMTAAAGASGILLD